MKISKSPKRQVSFLHDLEVEKGKLVKQGHYYNLILNKDKKVRTLIGSFCPFCTRIYTKPTSLEK